MDGKQLDLFEMKKDEWSLVEFENLVCPICKNTGYTKGTKCVCRED